MAFDPGLHTGIAIWDDKGKFIKWHTTHSNEELHAYLAEDVEGIKVVIYEDYRLFRHKAQEQVGSKIPAAQAIGIIETFARIWKAKIIKQPSSIKSTAEKWTGLVTAGMSHDKTHPIDAFNHGEYYMIKLGLKEIKIRGINEARDEAKKIRRTRRRTTD